MLYSVLWTYRTSVKTAIGFSPFQLVYGLEAVLPIECQIPSLKLTVELLSDTSSLEECLLYLKQLYEKRRDATSANEAHKKESSVSTISLFILRYIPKVILSWYMIKTNMSLGEGKFKPMWFRKFIVKEVLKKGSYHLVDFEGNSLEEPRNRIYFKKYYS
jgi:hypothetical protein